MLLAHNGLRNHAGRHPLVLDQRLNDAAQFFAQWQAKNPGDHPPHKGFEEFRWAKIPGHGNKGAENCHRTDSLQQWGDAIRAWMDSPGHRANLMNDIYRAMGLGVCQRFFPGPVVPTFWVVIFSTPMAP
jgi:uncharacterized protein YkwD